MTADAHEVGPSDTCWHEALLYRTPDEYVEGVLSFLEPALSADEPVFVAVPAPNAELLRAGMNGGAARVRFADMSRLGRNPSRIIPAIQAFIDRHADRQVSFVGEPIWPGRTPAETTEATRHEALINTAFEGAGASILCPYDAARLDGTVVADASRTHPQVVDGGTRRPSRWFTDPVHLWETLTHLPHPPHDAVTVPVDPGALAVVRALARQHAEVVRLPAERIDDLLVAVTELATNSVVHGGATGTVTLWTEPGTVVCEVSDAGRILDPLIGRRSPDPAVPSGRGLWLVNHLCDLVQLRSTGTGTSVRVRVSRGPR